MVRRRQLHLLGHLPLLLRALTAIVAMTQACTGGGGDAGFGDAYGYGDDD